MEIVERERKELSFAIVMGKLELGDDVGRLRSEKKTHRLKDSAPKPRDLSLFR